jgi:hypothetical protein
MKYEVRGWNRNESKCPIRRPVSELFISTNSDKANNLHTAVDILEEEIKAAEELSG